jgi:hypothetical protein
MSPYYPVRTTPVLPEAFAAARGRHGRRPPSPLQDDDLRADADAIVKVDDVVVHHADAA